MKNAIITGPTGAIGTALIEELTDQGIGVLALVRPGSSRVGQIHSNPLVHIVELGLDSLEKLPEMVKKMDLTTRDAFDVFYHLGWDGTFGNARDNMPGQLKNIEYTLKAVEVARACGCSKFVGCGSQAEYGRVEGKLQPDTATNPENGYGIAKLAAGQMSRIHAGQLGIDHVWVRILSVYGPGDGANTMVSSLISKLQNGEVPELTMGQQQWDYLFSKDAGLALRLIGQKGINGKTYVLGSGEARPLRQYIETIRDIVAPGAELGFGQVPYSDKQVMHLQADISELTQDTGFVPKYSFEDGIRILCN